MDVTRSIDSVDETLECVFLWRSTDAEVDRQPETKHWKFGTRKSKCGRMVRAGTSGILVTLRKRGENKSFAPLTKWIPWPL